MDIIDQVAQLLSEFETTEKKRRASLELGKAILLQAATGAYLTHIRKHEWSNAREQLDRILMVVVNMIPDLPSEES